ncbi:MAG: DUF2254 domain-containing protein [Micropruina sp.]|nr:MAG: DUF2254 domain-containing protein [Micropruina sp.]
MRRRESLMEYLSGALWVLPTLAGLVSILAGWGIAQIEPAPGSALDWFTFKGSSSQARDVLTAIAGTIVTVMALVLGLSVVALQLTSTQYSPRLLRNFLRDRPNQIVLSVFMATFCFAAAGLDTVGVGPEPERFPRIAVNVAILLLFASLAAVVMIADHVSHAIQVDAIMRRVERESLGVVSKLYDNVDLVPPEPRSWAISVPARTSGYVVTAHPEILVPRATQYRV